MNATIGVWALVVGSWILPPIEPTPASPGVAAVRLAAVQSTRPETASEGSPAPRTRRAPPATSPPPGRLPDTAPKRDQPQQYTPEPPEARIPAAPTDRSAKTPNLFGFPDGESGSPDLPGLGGGFGSPMGHRAPGLLPTGRRGSPSSWSRQAPSYNSYAAQRAMQPQIGLLRPSAAAGSAFAVQRPFDDYRLPDPISPYLNMYRYGASETTNYYLMVKPLQQQRRANTLFGGQIGGLQGAARRQGSALRTLGRDTRALQGRPAPNYYRNYGNFYPGLKN